MIAGLLCAIVGWLLIWRLGDQAELLALPVALLGLWFVFGGGERWLARREAHRG